MGDLVKIGALWLREGKKGKFLGGEVKVGDEKISLLVFKNTRKAEGSKHPDYEIFQGGNREAKPTQEPGEDDAL